MHELLELQAGMDAGEWRDVSDTAQVVANYLRCHPRVAEVRYPGLTSDPCYREASSTLRGGFGPWVDLRLSATGKWLRFVALPSSRLCAKDQVLGLEAFLG